MPSDFWTSFGSVWRRSGWSCIRRRPGSSNSGASRSEPQGPNLGKPETFAFLGFTHICGRRQGRFLILRHTVRERLQAKLRQVKETIWRMMHRPIAEQGLYLKRVVNGFHNYFAVPTNSRAINSFYRHVAGLAALPPAAEPAAG